MEDENVRSSHAALHGQARSWDQSSLPGEEHNCRCMAAPIELAGVNIPAAIIAAAIAAAKQASKQVGKAAKKVKKAPKNPNPKDILSPGGKPIGKRGNSPRVRIEKGGTPHTPKGYGGKGVKLPNGDWAGYRPDSKSGLPTIDVNVKGIDFRKIHFP